MSLPATELDAPRRTAPGRELLAAARWALAGAACAGGAWAAGLLVTSALWGGHQVSAAVKERIAELSAALAIAGALTGLITGVLVGLARPAPRRGSRTLTLAALGAAAGAAGGALSVTALIPPSPHPLVSSSLLWAAVGLFAGLMGYSSSHESARRQFRALRWALAAAGVTGGAWGVALIAARTIFEVPFAPSEDLSGVAGTAILYAALGAGYGLLVGAATGLLRGGDRRGTSALVLGVGGMLLGALGGALGVLAVAATVTWLHPIVSSSLAWSAVGFLAGLLGSAWSRHEQPRVEAEDIDEDEAEPAGPKVEWLLRETKRPWRDRPLVRVLPVLVVSSLSLTAAVAFAPSDLSVAQLMLGLLGLAVALVLFRQEERLRVLEGRLRGGRD